MPTKITVCEKVSESLRVIEQSMTTRSLDAPKLAGLLHSIRKDAQRMETALKARKKVMEDNGLEEEYQKSKGKVGTVGVNKMSATDERVKDAPDMRAMITKDGEVIYDHPILGAVMSVVESLTDIDEDGNITAVTQNFVVGKDLQTFVAFDQLRQAFESKKMGILALIADLVHSGKMKDPEVRRKIIEIQGTK